MVYVYLCIRICTCVYMYIHSLRNMGPWSWQFMRRLEVRRSRDDWPKSWLGLGWALALLRRTWRPRVLMTGI